MGAFLTKTCKKCFYYIGYVCLSVSPNISTRELLERGCLQIWYWTNVLKRNNKFKSLSNPSNNNAYLRKKHGSFSERINAKSLNNHRSETRFEKRCRPIWNKTFYYRYVYFLSAKVHHHLLRIRLSRLLQFRHTSEIINRSRVLADLLGQVTSPPQAVYLHNAETWAQTWSLGWDSKLRSRSPRSKP